MSNRDEHDRQAARSVEQMVERVKRQMERLGFGQVVVEFLPETPCLCPGCKHAGTVKITTFTGETYTFCKDHAVAYPRSDE